MFFMNKTIEPKEMKISEVSENHNYLRIRGEITKFNVSESGTTFLEIQDETGSIDVVIFKDSIRDMPNIETGSFIEVMGKPQKYKGGLEIIANRIK